MEAVVAGIRDALSRGLQQTYMVANVALEQHRDVLNAIEASDPDAAVEAMTVHLDWIEWIIPEELGESMVEQWFLTIARGPRASPPRPPMTRTFAVVDGDLAYQTNREGSS